MLGFGKSDKNSDKKGKCKFIVVTGGVISGLGKGVITASIANVLQAHGYNVSAIKIDPYINIDAGTMRPTEHGEVWVTDDGGETDQDLGTYERFLGKSISKLNNITTGQVYQKVISMERNLDFGGKCVEVIPHIPEEIERRIKEVAEKEKLDFLLIEVGGTVGDYQNVLFLEAMRRMNLKGDPMVFVHVVYLPIPKSVGEMKTKPAQHSVRMLNEVGIQPHFIMARSEKPLDDVRKEKISIFCNVKPENVISNPDLEYVYELPLIYENQDFTENILRKFDIKYKKTDGLDNWRKFVNNIKTAEKKVKIAIVGKYFDIGDFTLEDSYVSVIEAIKHASGNKKVVPEIVWMDSKDFEKDENKLQKLNDIDGVIVPGGFGSTGIEGKILVAKYCRENNVPYLGLCLGLQIAVIEFARNVCGLEGSNSTEFDKNTKHPSVCILPDQVEKMKKSQYGGTMRLGGQDVKIVENTIAEKIYGKNLIRERFRHRFEINPELIENLKNKGLVFSGMTPDNKIMQIIELSEHIFFMGSQFHPEFTSRPINPNPLFTKFIESAIKISDSRSL